MSLVLDASVAIEWFLEDRNAAKARRVAVRLLDDSAAVPQLWPLEIANVLTLALRKKRIDAETRKDALATLSGMDIEVDPETVGYAWTSTLSLADKHQLTVYDASYLELALRRTLPLATFDQALADAARAEGVEVLP